MKVYLGLTTITLCTCLLLSCTSSPKDTNGSVVQSVEATSDQPKRADSILVPSDSLIIPGQSIGSLALNTDAAIIMKKFGQPDAGDAAMGKFVATWFAGHDSTGHVISIFTSKDVGNSETALVKQIRVTAPGFKTQQGIGTATSLTQLRKFYKLDKEKGYRIKQQDVTVYSDSTGIAFEMDKRDRCIGIVIYPKGELHPDTYSRFLPGMRTQ